jgi:hypothetical protein
LRKRIYNKLIKPPKTKTKVKKSHDIILATLIILFPALFIPQGLDLTDTGFHLARVSNFMEQQSGGIVWFSFFIGYLWEKVFGQFGLLGFKILSYLLYELTVWTVFFGFRKIFPRKYLMLYIFLGMLLTLSIKTFFFSYDNVSNLFLVLGGTLLLVGVITDSRIKILLAGFVFALSAFSRLPDVLSLALIALFPLYEFLKKYQLRDIWESRVAWLRSTGIYIGGFVLGVAVVLVTIRMVGQLDRVLGSIAGTLNIFADSDGGSAHSASGMITKQLESGKRMFNSALLFVLVLLLFSWLIQQRAKVKRILYYALAVIGSAVFIFFRTDHQYFVNYVNIFSGSQIALAMIFFLNIFRVEARYRFVLLSGIAIMVVSYMGSDTGLLKSATGWFITLPALLMIFDETGDLKVSVETNNPPRVWTIPTSSLKNFIMYVIILTSLMIRYVAVFGDEGSRLEMVHPVEIPLARGNLTTSGKAENVREIYDDLQKYTGKDDYLVGIGGGPLFIYLTGARFYIPSTWILWYRTEDIVPDLEEAYHDLHQLPVILIAREALFRTVYEDEMPEIRRQREEIHQFIGAHDYRQVVKKENYEIWVPAE